MSMLIPLHGKHSDGKFTIVDDDDYERLNRWEWHYDKGYVTRGERKDGVYRKIVMHREIMRTPEGMSTDHIDGNTLDNRKSNLRVCTHTENMHNRGPQRNSISKFKGVSYNKRNHLWQAYITVNGNIIHLGYFDVEEDAARAVDRAALKYRGEFARLNFPKDDPTLFTPNPHKHIKSSQYRGVVYKPRINKWEADIRFNGKTTYLGTYEHEEDAAVVVDKAAIKYFGCNAKLNFPRERYEANVLN